MENCLNPTQNLGNIDLTNLTISSQNVMHLSKASKRVGCKRIDKVPNLKSDMSEKCFGSERDICMIPKQRWNSIVDWLSVKEREKEAQEKQQAYRNHMREMSTKLVAGRSTLKEEAFKRLEAKQNKEHQEAMILNDYLRITKNQNEKRKKIVQQYNRLKLIKRSPALELSSALRHAEVLYERQKQVELKKHINEKEQMWKAKEYEEYKRQIEAAEEFHRRKEEHLRCKAKELKDDIRNQCQNNKEKKRKEYIETLNQERAELAEMKEEWDEIQKIKDEEHSLRKKKALALLKESAENARQKRHFEKKEEREIYEVNEIIKNTSIARDCRVKAQMKKEFQDKVDRNVAILVKYKSQLPPIVPSEDTIYENGVRRNQEDYEKRMNEKNQLLKNQADDKIRNYQEGLKRQKQKDEEDAELKRMEMVERYKKVEALKYLDDVYRQKEVEKKKNYGKELINQASELRALREHEKKLEDDYIFTSFESQDDHFADYADEVLKYAQERGWPTITIKKAIAEYKKNQPIVFMKRKEEPCNKSSVEVHYQKHYKGIPSHTEKKFIELESKVKSLP